MEEKLSKIGFTSKEIKIYLLIFERRRILPAQISKETGINRATVYSVASSLLEKGLVTEDLAANNRKYLVAKPAEFLVKYIDKEKRRIDDSLKIAEEITLEMKEMNRNPFQKLPKIRFIPENQIRDFLYEQTPYWEASMEKTQDFTYWGFQDIDFPERFAEWINWYWSRADIRFNLKLISADSTNKTFQELKKRHIRRLLEPWEAKPEFTTTLWVHGEYIVILVLQQKPNYVIEIHDALLAQNLREVFRGIWSRDIAPKNK